jgi:ATP-dependent Clp protease ATP-binding subunit ClpA
MGLDLETARLAVEKKTGTGPDQKVIGNIPYTPRVKKVLALASKEAKALHHTYVGTEHILLGLLREGDGIAAQVLKDLDVDLEQTRQAILKELDPNFQPATDTGGSSRPTPAAAPPSGAPTPRSQRELLDLSKRYDVYCTERNGEVVVYRNARFKGIKSLFARERFDLFYEFVELEQGDGGTIFLGRHSILKFCEHGVTPGPEGVSGKQE